MECFLIKQSNLEHGFIWPEPLPHPWACPVFLAGLRHVGPLVQDHRGWPGGSWDSGLQGLTPNGSGKVRVSWSPGSEGAERETQCVCPIPCPHPRGSWAGRDPPPESNTARQPPRPPVPTTCPPFLSLCPPHLVRPGVATGTNPGHHPTLNPAHARPACTPSSCPAYHLTWYLGFPTPLCLASAGPSAPLLRWAGPPLPRALTPALG